MSKFKNNFLNLNTRQFGTAVEVVVALLKKYSPSQSLEFDLISNNGKKYEVKSSRVYKSHEKKLKINMSKDDFYNTILKISNRDRLIKKSEIKNHKFDCNIQQVKPKLFDDLIYLLFYKDVFDIFQIKSKDILKDKKLKYSKNQHRGNKDEGQFHINNDTIQAHQKYLKQTLNYDDIIKLLKKKERK